MEHQGKGMAMGIAAAMATLRGKAGKALSAAWSWLSYWREVPWTLLALAGVVFGYYLIPQIDPTAGIDGWGDLWATGVAVLKGMVIAFSAWFCKDHFMVDLSSEDETLLMDRASRGEGIWVLLIERVTFFVWLLLWWSLVA